jgi:hypothetical protein
MEGSEETFELRPGVCINPSQRRVDSTDNGRRNDTNWDGVWFSRSKVLEDRWSAEIAVPFKTLRCPSGDVLVPFQR